MAPSSWKIRQNGGWEARRLAGFFDWNTHFVVFSGGVERGLGGLTARSGWKIRQNGGWEARRIDLAGLGLFTPPPSPAAQFFNLRCHCHKHLLTSRLQKSCRYTMGIFQCFVVV